ncbi:MAG TPA: quinone oxidoreductase [Candidatus Binataceae bacterium]|nr:quinone oxidoreductase [Candidatus Binataceae bacterium]
MKAIQFDRLGGAEVMELREVPVPELRPGTVLVKNQVIAINYGDTFFIRGTYLVKPKFPDTPGMEAAGVIASVAPDVKDLTPGMRVAYIGMGAYADYTLIRAGRVMPIPDEMGFEQAASFPIAVLTAWHMIHTCNDTKPGQFVVVHSAAGGAGIAAVQIAKAAGAKVIGTVSNDDKIELVRKFGAEWVINYERDDFGAEAMKITGGRGVDLILDAVGKPTFEKGLRCLAPLGHMIIYGRAGGAPGPVNPLELFGKSIKVSGFAVTMMYALTEHHRRALDDVFRLEREGKLTVPIGGRFPLADAVEAHRFLESRRSTGKLLLVP